MNKPDDVDRLNRMIEDVFWVRWGRDANKSNPDDRPRIDAIRRWQIQNCPLPGETVRERRNRVGVFDALSDLSGPALPSRR